MPALVTFCPGASFWGDAFFRAIRKRTSTLFREFRGCLTSKGIPFSGVCLRQSKAERPFAPLGTSGPRFSQ